MIKYDVPPLITNKKVLFIIHELYYEGGCLWSDLIDFIMKYHDCNTKKASIHAFNALSHMSNYFAIYDEDGCISSLNFDNVNCYVDEVLGGVVNYEK